MATIKEPSANEPKWYLKALLNDVETSPLESTPSFPWLKYQIEAQLAKINWLAALRNATIQNMENKLNHQAYLIVSVLNKMK